MLITTLVLTSCVCPCASTQQPPDNTRDMEPVAPGATGASKPAASAAAKPAVSAAAKPAAPDDDEPVGQRALRLMLSTQERRLQEQVKAQRDEIMGLLQQLVLRLGPRDPESDQLRGSQHTPASGAGSSPGTDRRGDGAGASAAAAAQSAQSRAPPLRQAQGRERDSESVHDDDDGPVTPRRSLGQPYVDPDVSWDKTPDGKAQQQSTSAVAPERQAAPRVLQQQSPGAGQPPPPPAHVAHSQPSGPPVGPYSREQVAEMFWNGRRPRLEDSLSTHGHLVPHTAPIPPLVISRSMPDAATVLRRWTESVDVLVTNWRVRATIPRLLGALSDEARDAVVAWAPTRRRRRRSCTSVWNARLLSRWMRRRRRCSFSRHGGAQVSRLPRSQCVLSLLLTT